MAATLSMARCFCACWRHGTVTDRATGIKLRHKGSAAGAGGKRWACSHTAGIHLLTRGLPDQPGKAAEEPLHRFDWQESPNRPFQWCDLCAGVRFLECEVCRGEGVVATEPGNAGVQFYVGRARCSQCNGMKRIPCPLCIGYECDVRLVVDESEELQRIQQFLDERRANQSQSGQQ